MQNLWFVVTVLLRFACTALGYAFTEPPVDDPDYTRTYELGQTVFVAWNQTASAWPRVHLRLDPISATDVHEYAVTYATLIENAPNTGTFEWTIGQNDNVTLDLVQNNPRMFFQLNDATGADNFTLDSVAFLVLGGSQISTSTSTSSTASATATSSASPPRGLSQAGKVGVGIGIPFAVLCLGLLLFLIFKLRTRKGISDGSGMNQQRPELESAAQQSNRNTVLSYGSEQTATVPPYANYEGGAGPELAELAEK